MSCTGINNKGFTLIELMISVALFGIILTGMYTAYTSMNKTTANQENLVDVQQNLRVALNMIVKDIKMAGALVPAGTDGIAAGSNATRLNLLTASGFSTFARIAADEEVTTAETSQTFNIAVPTSVERFQVNDKVRIIRPQDGSQPFDPTNGTSSNNELVVTATAPGSTPPTITIGNFPTSDTYQYLAGDIIARVSTENDAPDPSTIVWYLSGSELRRNIDDNDADIDTGFDLVASDIALAFDYLLEDGTEVTTPTNAQLEDINAVRVTLTANATRQADGQTRQRSLSSISYLRN